MTGGDAVAFASAMVLIGWVIWLIIGWPNRD